MPCAIAQPRQCLVVGVSDGDTLTVRCDAPGQSPEKTTRGAPRGFEQVKIRLAAIDAPESRQAFGQRSKQALSQLCFQAMATIRQRSIDRYGRTVADVECRGQDAGESMVANGWAWVYERYTTIADGRLFQLQRQAQVRRVGLWAEQAATPPWEWRRMQRER